MLFENLDLVITPKTRLGLLGANGIGKSTLIKIITGDIEADKGEVIRSDSISVAYFEQNRDSLDPELSLLRTICPYGETVEFQGRKTHIRSYLDRFLFTQEQSEMPIGRFSGGEQARVLLAMLMLKPANLLILDEPTNDLDISTLGVLEDCLSEFDGAVILVSHDRAFMDEVCTQILAFPEMRTYSGIDQWESARPKGGDRQPGGKTNVSTSTAGRDSPAPQKRAGKLSYKDQREYDGIETLIQQKEAALGLLQEQVDDPKISADAKRLHELMKELGNAQNEIEHLYTRWTELEQMLNGGK